MTMIISRLSVVEGRWNVGWYKDMGFDDSNETSGDGYDRRIKSRVGPRPETFLEKGKVSGIKLSEEIMVNNGI